jgi:hypothetical protein
MPRPGFYNDNEYRAYPFIFKAAQTSADIPNTAVVDCGIIMGLDSEFEPQTHDVWLHEIRRVGSVFEFELRTSAPGASNQPLVFTRAVSADEWQTEFVESGPYLDDPNSCAVEAAWSGFLVTGPLADLQAALPANGALAGDDLYTLEPNRIQSLVRTYLRAITVANLSRPLANFGCSDAVAPRTVIINARCLSGEIRFKEGYNCQIRQRDSSNEISIGAVAGAGAPIDSALCANGSELPFFEGELPPENSKFFSGGPACDELVTSINGVAGPDVNFIGGPGVRVTTDPGTNTITIELDPGATTSGCGNDDPPEEPSNE